MQEKELKQYMKRLKDITKGNNIYTIMIEYHASGEFKKIVVLSRTVRCTNIIKEENTLSIYTEHTEATRFYGTHLSFYLENLHKNAIKVHRMGYEFIYAFSEEAFIRELRQLLLEVKKTMMRFQKHLAIMQFYNKFMADIIQILYSPKTKYAILNNI